MAGRTGRGDCQGDGRQISIAKLWAKFAERIFYHAGDIGEPEDFDGLASFLDDLEKDPESTRIYYLATAPQFYEPAIEQLGRAAWPRRIPAAAA